MAGWNHVSGAKGKKEDPTERYVSLYPTTCPSLDPRRSSNLARRLQLWLLMAWLPLPNLHLRVNTYTAFDQGTVLQEIVSGFLLWHCRGIIGSCAGPLLWLKHAFGVHSLRPFSARLMCCKWMRSLGMQSS